MNQLKTADVQSLDNDVDDSTWVEMARDGEAAGWEELHRRYYAKLWTTVNQIVMDGAMAEDVVQEAFIKAFRQIKNFRGGSKFGTWIYRIAVNQAFDSLRKKNRRQKWLGLFPLPEPNDEESSAPEIAASTPPMSEIERGDHRAALEKALKELTPEHRAVVELRLMQGLSTDETAHVVGCRRGTVLSRLYYACQKLQPMLRRTYEEL